MIVERKIVLNTVLFRHRLYIITGKTAVLEFSVWKCLANVIVVWCVCCCVFSLNGTSDDEEDDPITPTIYHSSLLKIMIQK